MRKIIPTILIAGALLMAAKDSHAQNHGIPPVREDHGITLFYTTDTPVEDLTGLKFPEVYGGELIIFWHEFEPEDGVFDWSRMDRDFETWHAAGKKLDIRLATAHVSPIYTPQWVFENHQVRRVGRGIFEDFENDSFRFNMGESATLTDDPDLVFSGNRALLIDNRLSNEVVFLEQNSSILHRDTQYSVQWDMLPIENGICFLEMISEENRVLERHRITAGGAGWNVVGTELNLGPQPGQRMRLVAPPNARFAIDNLNIIRTSPTTRFRKTDLQQGEIQDWEVVESDGPFSTETFTKVLQNSPGHFPLRLGDGLQLRFTLSSGTEGELRVIVRSSLDPTEILYDRIQAIEPGKGSSLFYHIVSVLPHDHFQLEVLYRGGGDFHLETAAWRNWTDRVTVFPDYFSDDFNRLWRRAVSAFADRYRDHPALGIVSVGGFGRWEEVMLDEDVYGALDDQWLSRGFTQEKFLQQVVDSMDLYRELLPDARLRICLAYGLRMVNDVDWVYRRTAQAAVERGIGLKQNGLSEKYDTWDSNTNTSYLYHYYRHHEGISLTHETGGQIFRNSAEAHGYPLSLLNRTTANFTEYLFLYFNDIHGRHIRKYFQTFLEHARLTTTTTFHTWLGDMSQVHEHRSDPVATQNSWHGLRQFDGPGHTPIKTRVDGEKVLKTNASNTRIVLDVDDRFQYGGMLGTELSVDYYDHPEGPFHVQVFDQTTRKWRALGTVMRTGGKDFKRAFFFDTTWNNSPRHGGEDDHADLIIKEPTGTAPLSLRNVEMQFIAPGDWRMDVHGNPGKPHRGVLGQPSLTHDVIIPPGHPLPHAVSITLYVPTIDRSVVIGRVYKVDGQGRRESLLTEKEFYIPADKDTLFLPFVPTRNLSKIRVELRTLEGDSGWYVTEDGTPPITLHSFEENRSEAIIGEYTDLPQGQERTGIIATDRPIQAMVLHFGETSPDYHLNLVIQRELPGSGWSAPLIRLENHLLRGADTLHLPLVPQTAGRFRVKVSTHWGTGSIATQTDGSISATLVGLHQRQTPRPPRITPVANITREYLYPTDFEIVSGLERVHDNTEEALRVVDFDPSLEIKTDLIASNRQFIHLYLKNDSGSNMARVQWAGEDGLYEPGNYFHLPLVPNDSYVRQYTFPIGLDENWKGKIGRIMLKPVIGSTRHGFVSIEKLEISEVNVHTDLVFTRPLDHLVPERDVRSLERTSQGLLVTLDAPRPVLRVPLQDFNLETCDDFGGEVMILRLRNMTTSTEMQLLWHVPDQQFMNPGRAFEKGVARYRSATVPITPNDGGIREYRFRLSELPGWSGHIVALAIVPVLNGEPGDQVLIESLQIVDSSALSDSVH